MCKVAPVDTDCDLESASSYWVRRITSTSMDALCRSVQNTKHRWATYPSIRRVCGDLRPRVPCSLVSAVKELRATGEFQEMDIQTDEDEHSIEMHLPYVRKVFEG